MTLATELASSMHDSQEGVQIIPEPSKGNSIKKLFLGCFTLIVSVPGHSKTGVRSC